MSGPRTTGSILGHRAGAFGAGLCHAILLALSFPLVGWWFMAFLAPLPLFRLALRREGSVWGAGFWAMLGVAPFWVYTHAWVASVSAAGVYPLVVYLSLYTMAFVVIARRCLRAPVSPILVLTLVWCGLEFFRGAIGWSGYAWYLLGHPMIDSPNAGLAWPAMLGGVPLVSALVAMPGAWWVTRGSSGGRAKVAVAAALVAWAGWALFRPVSSGGGPGTLRIGIVQTNVPQDNRIDWSIAQRLDDWLTMRAQTERVAAMDPPPDVIVWPEGLVPGWTFDPISLALERSRPAVWPVRPESDEQAVRLARYLPGVPASQVADEILAMQRSLGIPMLLGAVAHDNLRIERGQNGFDYDWDAMYNSVFLVRGGRVGDVWYDKMHLTPFGEVMPYISAWPWLEDRLLSIGAEGMSFTLAPGRAWKTLGVDLSNGSGAVLATPICFEATVASVCRKLARNAARSGVPCVLVNVTNDGWFAGSDRGRRMHAHASRWRCVELGVPMVRVANTGVSGAIDRFGREVLELPPREPAEAVVSVVPGVPGTVYSRTGEWAGWASLASVVGLLWLGRRGKSGRGPESSEESA